MMYGLVRKNSNVDPSTFFHPLACLDPFNGSAMAEFKLQWAGGEGESGGGVE